MCVAYEYKEFEMMPNVSAMGTARSEPPLPTRRTVDAFTRTLHGLLAFSFLGAYITAESEIFRWVHVTLGYTLGGLLLVRVVWGLLGPRHVRLSAIAGKLRGLLIWFQGLAQGQAVWRQGQNLYMALTVVVLLLVIAPAVLSGYVTYQEWTGDWMEEVHEFFGNFMLIAVIAHVASVVMLSLIRRRNLAAPMLTGRVEGAGPDLIKSNHGFLAALLLALVLSFWFWQGQASPQMQTEGVGAWLHPTLGKAQSDHREDDDD
jgi:cytochrome b